MIELIVAEENDHKGAWSDDTPVTFLASISYKVHRCDHAMSERNKKGEELYSAYVRSIAAPARA